MAHPLGGGGIDAAPGGHRSGQRHLGDMRIGHQRRADLPAPLHDVDDAGRGAGLDQDLGQLQRAQGRFLGGLEDHRIAHRQGGRGLPAGDLAGIVPGADARADAQRLAPGIGPVAPQRDHLSGDGRGQPAEIFQRRRARSPVGHQRFLNGLAGVQRFQPGQRRVPVPDQGSGARQHAAPVGGRHRRPGRLRAGRRPAGQGHLIRGRLVQKGDLPARIGVKDGQRGALALDKGAVDEQAGFGLGVVGHVRASSR